MEGKAGNSLLLLLLHLSLSLCTYAPPSPPYMRKEKKTFLSGKERRRKANTQKVWRGGRGENVFSVSRGLIRSLSSSSSLIHREFFFFEVVFSFVIMTKTHWSE